MMRWDASGDMEWYSGMSPFERETFSRRHLRLFKMMYDNQPQMYLIAGNRDPVAYWFCSEGRRYCVGMLSLIVFDDGMITMASAVVPDLEITLSCILDEEPQNERHDQGG